MSIQLVMLDLGGVLLHVEPIKLIQALVPYASILPDRIAEVLGSPDTLVPLERGQVSLAEMFEQLKRKLGLTCSFEYFARAWNGILREHQRTRPLLKALRRRYQVLVLTNINALHDEYVRQTWPMFGDVHHWVASYRLGLRKPEPAIYQEALRQAGVPASSAVFADDLEENVEAARRLGMSAVHVTEGLDLAGALRQLGLRFDA